MPKHVRKPGHSGAKSCWHGYHAEGKKKGKNGKMVNNCKPN